MKISKLFHWLYACLMLLPIAVFIPTAFYYGFNEQAQAQSKTETIITDNYYNTSEEGQPYTIDDLEYNTVYYAEIEFYDDVYYELTFQYLTVILCENVRDLEYIEITNPSIEIDHGALDVYSNTQQFFTEDSYMVIWFVVDENSNFLNQEGSSYVITSLDGVETLIPNGQNSEITTTYTMSITDSMSTAWTNTWSNPLFSWSADSFLATPFNYISDLFSIPQNSTFTMALSYWCAISVIYLVFDVIMYVPLLCHRWIDKAKIE